MSREQKVPDASHPITVTPSEKHVRVLVGEQVVADTTAAQSLVEAGYPEVLYVPLADVDESVLSRTDTATYCPYKGDAAYYAVTTADGVVVDDAGWTYDEPYDAVAPIQGHVAWYPDRVQVLVD